MWDRLIRLKPVPVNCNRFRFGLQLIERLMHSPDRGVENIDFVYSLGRYMGNSISYCGFTNQGGELFPF